MNFLLILIQDRISRFKQEAKQHAVHNSTIQYWVRIRKNMRIKSELLKREIIKNFLIYEWFIKLQNKNMRKKEKIYLKILRLFNQSVNLSYAMDQGPQQNQMDPKHGCTMYSTVRKVGESQLNIYLHNTCILIHMYFFNCHCWYIRQY